MTAWARPLLVVTEKIIGFWWRAILFGVHQHLENVPFYQICQYHICFWWTKLSPFSKIFWTSLSVFWLGSDLGCIQNPHWEVFAGGKIGRCILTGQSEGALECFKHSTVLGCIAVLWVTDCNLQCFPGFWATVAQCTVLIFIGAHALCSVFGWPSLSLTTDGSMW